MVSVIIPVYNAAGCLKACLESVRAQSDPDLQILLIDDGSTDDSRKICEEFEKRDHRFRLISQENAGVSAARNRGLALAEGEFLLFVDADDLLPERAVERLRQAASENVDLVIGAHEEFRGRYKRTLRQENRLWSPEQWKENFAPFDAMLSTLWGKLYRRRVAAEHCLSFDPGLPYCEDHVFNLRFCREIRRAKVVEAVCYRYRLGGVASSLQYYPDMGSYQRRLLEEYTRFFAGQVPRAFWDEKLREQLSGSIRHVLQHRPYCRAVPEVERILTLYAPFLEEPRPDAQRAAKLEYRKHFWAIWRKKGKIALWNQFHKRI